MYNITLEKISDYELIEVQHKEQINDMYLILTTFDAKKINVTPT